MFKFVFCALFVVAAAKPDILLTSQLSPLTTTTYLAPGTTTITKSASGFISQGPYLYSWPYGHLIKKRSAPWTFIEPTTYITKPLLTTYSSPGLIQTSPWTYSGPLHGSIATTHFIKKRSAPIFTTPDIAPTSSSASWYTPTLIGSAGFISTPDSIPIVSQPFSHETHLIKKRSPEPYRSPAFSPAINLDYPGVPVNTHNYPLSNIPTAHVYSHVY